MDIIICFRGIYPCGAFGAMFGLLQAGTFSMRLSHLCYIPPKKDLVPQILCAQALYIDEYRSPRG